MEHTPPAPIRRSRPAMAAIGPVIVSLLLAMASTAACSDDAEPVAPPSGDLSDVTHELQPTDQMRDAARQQCLDDPDLIQGYVKAVSPDDGRILSEFEIDCGDVRAEG